MRKIIHKQLRIVEPSIDHEHAKELHQIRALISEYPGILELVHEDLIRGLDEPETGRKGMMTAEQVFKVLLIKQMNGFSYKVLRYPQRESPRGSLAPRMGALSGSFYFDFHLQSGLFYKGLQAESCELLFTVLQASCELYGP